MLRRIAAAMMLACAVTAALGEAACASAQAALPFEVVPRLTQPHRSHAAAYVCALAGAGLVVSSFPLADTADRRYAQYLAESDPGTIEDRWRATLRADRLSSGALLGGELLLATSVYLRFLRRPSEPRVTLIVSPARCALACRF
jgi:hypothetical protein